MSHINRRNWLGLIGAGGLATALDPIIPSSTEIIKKGKSTYDYAKLNSNENPLGPSPKVREAMIEAFDYGCRYPTQMINGLAEEIAEKHGVTRDHIVITGGSREALKSAGLAYGMNGGEIITCDPVYKSLIVYAEENGAYINRVPLNSDLSQDLEGMKNRISNKTSLVFFCNPHNPTGSLVPRAEAQQFCTDVSEQTMLFADEVYFDYINEQDYPSMISMVKEDKNVMVARTFSKIYGLAGLRVGYLVARPDIAERVRKKVMSSTSILAVAAAKASLSDQSFYDKSIALNQKGLSLIYNTLDDLGLKYIPSHTNFVFFHTGRPIQKLIPLMRSKGVAIGRPFAPLLDWCRISTGYEEDVKQFCNVLREVMV